MDLEGLSELIVSYTETFPYHALEFLLLSLGHYHMLGNMTFLTGILIKEASLSVSFTETWLRPPWVILTSSPKKIEAGRGYPYASDLSRYLFLHIWVYKCVFPQNTGRRICLYSQDTRRTNELTSLFSTELDLNQWPWMLAYK